MPPKKKKIRSAEKDDPKLITTNQVVPYRGPISFAEGENPYRKIRLALGVSIPTLSAHMDYNRGSYRAVEYGSPVDPPPTVLAYFRSVHGIPEIVQRAAYFNFQVYTRKQNKRLFGDFRALLQENQVQYEAPDFVPLKSLHPFIRIRNACDMSPVDVASRLCIPITGISSWESSLKTKGVPKALVNALIEVGYSENEVRVLQDEYERYYKVARNKKLKVVYNNE